MKKDKILIVEDNTNTRRFLEAMLRKEFDILSADNGLSGVEQSRHSAPDLIILDLELPVISGYDTCSLIKKDPRTQHIPVILLSSRKSVTDVTFGLSLGADDYLPKPFDYKELLSRIKIRLAKNQQTSPQTLFVGEFVIDPTTREVSSHGKITHLTWTEFDILRLLAEKNGKIVPREEILKAVWKEDSQKTNDRTIDVHIRALRKKIPALSKHILSIYGVGYKLES
jgi:DNA-binding response OmpR family regulator